MRFGSLAYSVCSHWRIVSNLTRWVGWHAPLSAHTPCLTAHPAARSRTNCALSGSLEAMQHGTIRAMELDYARQVLDLAVESFVADTGSLQDRLCAAYVSHLIKLREENFTPALWLRFERLKKAVTMYAAKGDEGVVKVSTSKMTDNEASQWIKEILSLFSEVAGLDVMSRTRIS